MTLNTILTFCCIILFNNVFGQPSKKAEAKDWLALDPTTDSIAGISLYKAYELLKGMESRAVIVAVIDNGVDIEHEDLKNIIWTNTDEKPDNGIDDDKNGYVDDVHGWNFRGKKDGTIIENEQSGATQIYTAWRNKYENINADVLSKKEKEELDIYIKAKNEHLMRLNNSKDSLEKKYIYNIDYNSSKLIANSSSDPNDKYYGSPHIKLSPNLSHGTHVAGIIAAQRNNQIGMDGIADNVRIMPIVATTATGDERDIDVANAIRYAVDNGAKIINMSFSKLYSSNKGIIDDAIRYAERKNVLLFHSAGNDGVNIDSAINYHYPIAIYQNGKRAGNFITVGWNRPLFNYRLAHPSSNYGKVNVDVFAPGSDVFSTVPDNGYDFKSASSMSTPCVSGVAALLLSYFPSLTSGQIKDIILKSSFKPSIMVNRPGTKTKISFDSLSVSGGILNAYGAVKEALIMTNKTK